MNENMSEMLGTLLSALGGASQNSENGEKGEKGANSEHSGGEQNSENFFEHIDVDMLMKIGEIFSKFSSPNKNTDLLRALKPHMREENKEKIDTAIKIIKVTSLLPYLRESGFLDKIF